MSETNPAATAAASAEAAPHRYTAAMAAEIEARWQDFWDADGTYAAPNPTGDLAGDPELAAKPKKFIMDMFPYPSGAGLHVGHPLGYIATDVYAVPAHDRPQRPAHPWASTPSACPPSSTRCRPARTRACPPRPTSRT
ncbi:hypothetical protein LT493_21240 [Streptomyces tricolor]|nr:hypothetical protein [Streptomyces tricolor]